MEKGQFLPINAWVKRKKIIDIGWKIREKE